MKEYTLKVFGTATKEELAIALREIARDLDLNRDIDDREYNEGQVIVELIEITQI